MNSLTFAELYSGWTENRAVWNKSAEAVLVELRALEQVVPYAMKDFHTDNGGEFPNWALLIVDLIFAFVSFVSRQRYVNYHE